MKKLKVEERVGMNRLNKLSEVKSVREDVRVDQRVELTSNQCGK